MVKNNFLPKFLFLLKNDFLVHVILNLLLFDIFFLLSLLFGINQEIVIINLSLPKSFHLIQSINESDLNVISSQR